MSCSRDRLLAATVRNITREKTRLMRASRAPALTSLPQGAGKWPIMKQKQVPSDVYPRSRPDITATAPTKTMWRTLARFLLPRRGVTIPPAIMMNILKNGMFSTSLTVCLLLSFIQHAVQIQGLVIVVESLNQ